VCAPHFVASFLLATGDRKRREAISVTIQISHSTARTAMCEETQLHTNALQPKVMPQRINARNRDVI
jgi:hypothetical protein